jgi:hypothetical protein
LSLGHPPSNCHAAAASKSCFLKSSCTIRICPGGYSRARASASAGAPLSHASKLLLERQQDGHSFMIDGCHQLVGRGGEETHRPRYAEARLVIHQTAFHSSSNSASQRQLASHFHDSPGGDQPNYGVVDSGLSDAQQFGDAAETRAVELAAILANVSPCLSNNGAETGRMNLFTRWARADRMRGRVVASNAPVPLANLIGLASAGKMGDAVVRCGTFAD